MLRPDRSNEPHEPPGSSDQKESGPRGFGELSGGYRARWALSHPDMRREWRARDDNVAPSVPAFLVRGIEPAPDDETTGVETQPPLPNEQEPE